MKEIKELLNKLDYVRPNADSVITQTHGICGACGGFGPYSYAGVITDTLSKAWSLSKDETIAFSSRESMFCVFCGCSYRLRALAQAIVLNTVGGSEQSLMEACEQGAFDNILVAEINSCGVLHDILKNIPNLSYSEYGSTAQDIPDEDLMNLSYPDQRFDIVLTSDTLEHVPDPQKALHEIYRVLKPAGKHIFTIPITLDRPTKQRTRINNNKIEYIHAPSFHGSGEPDYLVWNEFGADFISLLEQTGLTVTIYFQNPLNLKDPSCVLIAAKATETKRPDTVYVDTEHTKPEAIAELSRLFPGKQIKPYAQSLNLAQQADRIKSLVDKLNFTKDHVLNIEDTLGDREKYIMKLTDDITTLQTSLNKVLSSRTWRIAMKIRNTKKSLLKTPRIK